MIDRTEVLVLTHHLSRTRIFGTGSNVTRDSVVVRLEDGDGVVGWGETYLVPGVVEAARAMTDSIVGSDADDAAAELTARPDAHRWALGAVSMALDDLRARQRGIPVSDLYGTRLRGKVRAYASSRGYLGGLSPEAAWSDEARTTFDDGFRAIKLRIGKYPVDEEIEAIERVVTASPPMTWMADGNGAYDLADSRRLGAALEELGFRWLEEPLPTNDYLAYAPLAGELSIPLAGGEILESAGGHGAVPAGGLVRPRPARRLDLWRHRRRPRDRDGRPGRRQVRGPARLQRGDRPRRDPPHPGRPAGPAGRAQVRRADPRARRRREPDPDRHPRPSPSRWTTAG